MSLQYSVQVRNAKLDAVETAIGTTPILEFRSGSMPANTAAARTGTILASAALPSDWMAAASAGSKVKAGTWTLTGLPAAGGGTDIGYFSIYEFGSPSLVHMQGTVTDTGGGGDMTCDNSNIAQDQVVTVNTFTLTAGNA